MIEDKEKNTVKLIDFGSSCMNGKQFYSYIQSRFYRAPEIILGCDYGHEIDMWSFGCMIAELYLGIPIFPGQDEEEQIQLYIEYIGLPCKEVLMVKKQLIYNIILFILFMRQRGSRVNKYFDIEGQPLMQYQKKNLSQIIADNDFLQFLLQCFQWNPKNRIKPMDALSNPWITHCLNDEIKDQHDKLINSYKILLASQKIDHKLKSISQTHHEQYKLSYINQNSLKVIKSNVKISSKGILNSIFTFIINNIKKKKKRTPQQKGG